MMDSGNIILLCGSKAPSMSNDIWLEHKYNGFLISSVFNWCKSVEQMKMKKQKQRQVKQVREFLENSSPLPSNTKSNANYK